MKPWWLMLAVACSNERGSHATRGTQPPEIDRTGARRSVDPTVSGAPISIRGVELERSTHAAGVLELGYRVELIDKTESSITVPARIMCRVGGYNVVYPTSAERKRPGPRLAALYRPDPFNEHAQACEVVFLVRGAPVAAVCLRDDALTDGHCPKAAFPPPSRTTSFSVEIARAALELRRGSAVVSGLFTLFEPLAVGRKFATQVRCEDAAGSATGEGELAFLPLDEVPVGASIYGPVAIFLDRTVEPSATCELRIVSRATSGAPTEEIHARYCLTTGWVRAGECERSQR